MSNQTFMALPAEISDFVVIKRTFQRVIEEIDKILGNRGNEPALTLDAIDGITSETALSLADVADLLEGIQDSIDRLTVTDEQFVATLQTIQNSINALDSKFSYATLDSTYYDFNATAWTALAQRGFFTALGSDVTNPPVALTPATSYNFYVDSGPTPGGGAVNLVTIEEPGVSTTTYRRVGDTSANLFANSWVAL